jgi:tRNA pseudouridine55 synthase
VVNRVRRATGVKRVGHAGTLDPLATGLLILLVGREFTKRQSEFLKQDKEYICTAQLGIVTDTYDSQGQTLSQADWDEVAKITRADLAGALENFRGQINQAVPAYSAVKIAGEKLYQKARRGKPLPAELPVRQVNITQLQLLDFQQDLESQILAFTIQVSCSSGTYIRSLIHDIGQQLRVGATVTALRRTKIGQLSVDQAISLNELDLLAPTELSTKFLLKYQTN